ncbi:MAG TPA: hypothetical protein VEV16_07245, partial [Daejeonella sp.]|nr:hypothetical protein [Daejeonella sp.]
MIVIVPIRATETEIEFPDYEVFKKDIVSFSLKKDLITLLNYEDERILDISFEVKDKNDILKNSFYKKHFASKK